MRRKYSNSRGNPFHEPSGGGQRGQVCKRWLADAPFPLTPGPLPEERVHRWPIFEEHISLLAGCFFSEFRLSSRLRPRPKTEY